MFAGVAELFFGQPRTVEGSPSDTAPLSERSYFSLTWSFMPKALLIIPFLCEDTCVDERGADTNFSYHGLQLIKPEERALSFRKEEM